jgi:hypothetical protein
MDIGNSATKRIVFIKSAGRPRLGQAETESLARGISGIEEGLKSELKTVSIG